MLKLRKLLKNLNPSQRKILKKQKYFLDFYDNLCDLLINDPVVRIPEFQGIFKVGAHSDLFRRLIFERKYEPDIVKNCLKYMDKDRDVIDVGANIGFFSVLFAKNISDKKILSIEPTKSALKRLYANLKLNNVEKKIIVFEGVVSNKSGVVELKIVPGKEEYSSLGKLNHPSIIGKEFVTKEVQSVCLDDLIAQFSLDPGFIKIDTEGAENLVFQGAKSILENNRPIVLSELSNDLLKANSSSSNEVITFIKRYDYKIIDPITPDIPAGSKKFGDILCVPLEYSK